jgi:hypothetical protein
MNSKDLSDSRNKNIKVNNDGTISPVDPTKPSVFTTAPTPVTQEPDKALEDLLLELHNCELENTYECMKNVKQTAQKILSLYIPVSAIPENKKPLSFPDGFTNGYNQALADIRNKLKGKL